MEKIAYIYFSFCFGCVNPNLIKNVLAVIIYLPRAAKEKKDSYKALAVENKYAPAESEIPINNRNEVIGKEPSVKKEQQHFKKIFEQLEIRNIHLLTNKWFLSAHTTYTISKQFVSIIGHRCFFFISPVGAVATLRLVHKIKLEY